jgi:DNA-binding GntR family transcriptional regulator
MGGRFTKEASMPSSDTVPSFRRGRVSDDVTSYLRDQILTGKLRAGEPLRVERLAAALGLSVTPIRESLLELLAEGYVGRITNRGYVVAESTRSGLEEQVLALAMITGELAARAATKITDEDLAQLSSLQRELKAADKAGEHERAEELNHAFHSLVNKAADSPRLAWLAQRNTHYVPRSSFASLDNPPTVCTHEHRQIMRALKERDPELAREAMSRHLIDSGEKLAALLDKTDLWSS